MKVLIYLGHPAHFHLFKHVIQELEKRKHTVFVLIKKKDVLEKLLSNANIKYFNVMQEKRGDSKFRMITSLLKRDLKILLFCIKNRPDLMIGSSVEIAQVGKLLGIPSVMTSEDDYDLVKIAADISFPFASNLLIPEGCRVGKYAYKTTFYKGYQKLAYLHPNWFTPDESKIRHLYGEHKRFFLLRLVSFTAYHDFGASGISDNLARQIIEKLEPYGNVYITPERSLPDWMKPYELPLPIEDIHHALAFAYLYIGDSQSMAMESALLGTPSIRYNFWVGKVSVLEELEHVYHLTFGIKLSHPEEVLTKIDEILSYEDVKKEWLARRENLLKDKIDVTRFFVWYIENYPKSVQEMHRDSSIQLQFQKKDQEVS